MLNESLNLLYMIRLRLIHQESTCRVPKLLMQAKLIFTSALSFDLEAFFSDLRANKVFVVY